MLFFINMLVGDGEDPVNIIIRKIKNGDSLLRDSFISDYRPFVTKSVYTVIKNYVDTKNSEEYSVGLIAFNEAINSFDESKNVNFFIFARQVIRRRLIDYIRSNVKNNNVYPLSFFSSEDSENMEDKIVDTSDDYENIETKEEIELFEKELGGFGITLLELVTSSPKHMDSRKLCIRIASFIAKSDLLYDRFYITKNLPMKELINKGEASRRTIERNRKFIVAICLILRSNLEVMKAYVRIVDEGRDVL